MNAEGWYRDPYGVHTDRWISDGRPTDLVRDDGVVSHDEPPEGAAPAALVESDQQPARPGDTMRADSDNRDYTNGSDISNAVLDGGIIGPDFTPR